MSLDQDNIVELIDEDGKKIAFEHIDTVVYKEKEYVLLLPVEPLEGIGEDEDGVVILRIVESEDGEDTYEGVEDEALLDAVFQVYMDSVDREEDLDD